MTPPKTTAISLRAQLAVLLTLTLLPLGLISLYQTWAVTTENQMLASRALLAEAQDAATQQQAVMQEAMGAATALAASLGASVDNAERCSRVLKRFVDDSEIAVWAGYVAPDLTVACASDDAMPDLTGWDAPLLTAEVKRPTFSASRRWPTSNRSVLAAMAPIETGRGFEGFVVVSIPHVVADAVLPSAITDDPAYFVTLSTDGTILSATNGIASAPDILPEDIKTNVIARYVDRTFEAQSPDGEDRLFAVTALIPDQVVLVASLPQAALASSLTDWQNSLALVFPVLMWASSLGIALYGLHRLVLRHLRALRKAMRRFALGERDNPQLALHGAPPEFEDTKTAFNRMVMILAEAEERTQRDLREKTVLLREVHHRVKNNLQMVASIMNLQARKTSSEEAKVVIEQLQRRIRGLAMIHRTLYTTPDMTTVDGAALIGEIVTDSQIAKRCEAKGITLEQSLDSVQLYPDHAVPLSMLLAEAIANAMKHVGRRPDGSAHIGITLVNDDNEVTLTIENSRGTPIERPARAEYMDSSGLGSRLIQAFIIQLSAENTIDEDDDSYRFVISFDAGGIVQSNSPQHG